MPPTLPRWLRSAWCRWLPDLLPARFAEPSWRETLHRPGLAGAHDAVEGWLAGLACLPWVGHVRCQHVDGDLVVRVLGHGAEANSTTTLGRATFPDAAAVVRWVGSGGCSTVSDRDHCQALDRAELAARPWDDPNAAVWVSASLRRRALAGPAEGRVRLPTGRPDPGTVDGIARLGGIVYAVRIGPRVGDRWREAHLEVRDPAWPPTPWRTAFSAWSGN